MLNRAEELLLLLLACRFEHYRVGMLVQLTSPKRMACKGQQLA